MINPDKKEDLKCRIVTGVDMILQEIEDYSRNKKNLSMAETMYITDIMKDCSEALKNVISL